MSAPVLLGYAESGSHTERQKHAAHDEMVQDPSGACAEQRQAAELNKVARLSVHFRSRLERGSD